MPGGDLMLRLPHEDLEEAAGAGRNPHSPQYSEEPYDARRHKAHDHVGDSYHGGPSSSSTSTSSTSSNCSTSTALLVDTDDLLEEGMGGGFESGAAPRVVIFTACMHVCDGVSLTIRKLRAHLQARGIASRIVSCGPNGWSEPNVYTVPSIPLPIINADDNFGYALGKNLTDEVKEKIKAFNPSVIHFTVPDFLALDALRWAKTEKIPTMATWHSNYADYLKFYHLEVIRFFVERHIRGFYVNMPIYVPTPYIRKRLIENGFPESRVGIWGRGVDLDMFNPRNRSMAFRRSKGIADDEVVILWVGRLVKEKSPDVWAEVIRRLHREGLKVRALVVGTGSYEENMKQLPGTEHLGWMSGPALAEVYASVDLFVFPSEVETFGNVTLEALASGVPCIASAGCSGHLVYHGVNGFVVDKADVEEYYALTKRLVVDAALRQQFADKARSSISTLEHDRVMDMMVANYEGVMKAYHQPGGDGSKTGNDVYLACAYYTFQFLLFIGTPLMKSYVAIAHVVLRLWACSFAFPHERLRTAVRTVCCLGRAPNDGTLPGGGAGAAGASTAVTFRNRMKTMAVCVWLSAILIIYHTYATIGWTPAERR